MLFPGQERPPLRDHVQRACACVCEDSPGLDRDDIGAVLLRRRVVREPARLCGRNRVAGEARRHRPASEAAELCNFSHLVRRNGSPVRTSTSRERRDRSAASAPRSRRRCAPRGNVAAAASCLRCRVPEDVLRKANRSKLHIGREALSAPARGCAADVGGCDIRGPTMRATNRPRLSARARSGSPAIACILNVCTGPRGCLFNNRCARGPRAPTGEVDNAWMTRSRRREKIQRSAQKGS